MIEQICVYPNTLVMGASAFIGAGIMAGNTIYSKYKEHGKKFVLNYQKLIDTTWQSIVAGIAASAALSCGWYAILIAMVTGYGVDKLCNKIKINKTQLFNVFEFVTKLITKK